MQTLNSEEKKLAEFACKVCRSKFTEKNPQAVGCAWRSLDNEYCHHVMNALRSKEDVAVEPLEKTISTCSCGGQTALKYEPLYENGTRSYWRVQCGSCGYTWGFDSRAERAIELWNRMQEILPGFYYCESRKAPLVDEWNFKESIVGGPFASFEEAHKFLRTFHVGDKCDNDVFAKEHGEIYRYAPDGKSRINLLLQFHTGIDWETIK